MDAQRRRHGRVRGRGNHALAAAAAAAAIVTLRCQRRAKHRKVGLALAAIAALVTLDRTLGDRLPKALAGFVAGAAAPPRTGSAP